MKKLAYISPAHPRKSWTNHVRALPVYLITALFLYATPLSLEDLHLIEHFHRENTPHSAFKVEGIL
ncbi:hypothetical protein HNQ57_002839 [Zhongshania antarctica]|uniref:Uncharacterized protein n=1 Tax=Zhongshania antarctica TaxID=641702 RepID=A0A840R5K2_9GAMM|nr:hypothetical protein [Zhongshania antarctica]MBB5188549.1 hypothetical protein [Zhongshania antarctica]